MIMDIETMKAWVAYTKAVIEINYCMREQGFLHAKMSYRDIDKGFKMQDKIVEEYFALGEKDEI